MVSATTPGAPGIGEGLLAFGGTLCILALASDVGSVPVPSFGGDLVPVQFILSQSRETFQNGPKPQTIQTRESKHPTSE